MKPVGKPDARDGHVRFDERGWETGRALSVRSRAHPRLYLTSLQQRLVKTGGRLVKHARYYWPLLAESHLRSEERRVGKEG